MPKRALSWLSPLAVLVLAAAVRFPDLGRHGYDLDEMWTAEVSVGRGSAHADLPTDVLIDPPPPLAWTASRPIGRPPPWAVWSHMGITHPPLYSVLLRLWQELFGPGDARERGLSAVASTLAVLVLYDAVWVRSGTGPAFWAAVLMAVAVPQVEYARITRGYAVLTLAAVVMADAMVRIDVGGPTRRRTAALAAATAATLLTHYFAAAAVAAVAAYAALVLHGPARRSAALGLAVGTAAFGLAWLPFLPAQLRLFAPDDAATAFLRHDVPDHVAQTLWRASLVPMTSLFPQPPHQARAAAAAAVLYAIPLLALRRVRPDLVFWGLWLCGTAGLVTALDLARGTTHLFYVRYSILAGPAVCALVPTVLAGGRWRWAGYTIAGIAAAGCLLAGGDHVRESDRDDPHAVAAAVRPPLSAADVVVFAGPPREAQFLGGQYLLFDRYMGPVPCPIVLLTRPASPAVLDRIARSRRAWLFTDASPWRQYLPGVTVAPGGHWTGFLGYGVLYPIAAERPAPATAP